MGSIHDPFPRVMLGMIWIIAAGFAPIFAGVESPPTADVAAAYYAAGLVIVPLAVLFAFGIGTIASHGLEILGVAD